MSVTATLYINNSDNDHITKKLSSAKSVSILFKDDTSIDKPVLILRGAGGQNPDNNWATYNYLYIGGAIKRYYYIIDRKITTKGIWEISCKSDPLMSFKDQLLKLSGIVTRNSMDGGSTGTAKFDRYIRDDRIVTTQDNYSGIWKFDETGANPFTDDMYYVLVAAGGNI